MDRMDALQAAVNVLSDNVRKLYQERTALGEWVPEKKVIEITGLSRSTLLALRNQGKLSQSSIAGKSVYYKLSDFKKLLERNKVELI
jgi:predicted DNA-binding transcriptional regulator AlpA